MMCRAKLSIFWITALSETGFSRRHRVIVSVHQETKDNGRSVSQAVAGFQDVADRVKHVAARLAAVLTVRRRLRERPRRTWEGMPGAVAWAWTLPRLQVRTMRPRRVRTTMTHRQAGRNPESGNRARHLHAGGPHW